MSASSEDLHWYREWRERQASNERGEDIWFNETFGGEAFFAYLASPHAGENQIDIGFEELVRTPRSVRFDVWGAINNPDCEANPTPGGMDICDDPTDTGVVGIKKFPDGAGGYNFGISCASCHAGFDPVNPPANPNEPSWDNIHPTIGNLYLKAGNIFAVNLPDTDPRKLMFSFWNDGTVDTTALFNDNIMNPGTVTAFWNHDFRPRFDNGTGELDMRNGQGGEDDVGGDLAALRVYTNIGVCFFECVAPAVATDTPISIDACRARCDDFPTEAQTDDLSNFLASVRAPQYRGRVNFWKYAEGRAVFEATCESCHDSDGFQRLALSNDEVNAIGPDIPGYVPPGFPALPYDYTLGSNPQSTNTCRIRTTNWEEGEIWAEFSSPLYKERTSAGGRGHRTMPLVGIWSTSPFMHNNSIGVRAPADATPEERAEAFEESMRELLSYDRVPQIDQVPFDITLPDGRVIPEGTFADLLFSRDPDTGEVLCLDPVENRGHYFGADLSEHDKEALIHWLKFQ